MTISTFVSAFLLCLPGLALAQGAAPSSPSATSRAIDTELWAVVSATVVHADIKGMAATYHPDAVVVSGNGSRPIRSQLAKWGADMVTATKRRESATVEFRFSDRRDDATTAFEIGIFKYTVTDSTGKSVSRYVPLEALLVHWQGKWRLLMERQLSAVTVAEWDRLPH